MAQHTAASQFVAPCPQSVAPCPHVMLPPVLPVAQLLRQAIVPQRLSQLIQLCLGRRIQLICGATGWGMGAVQSGRRVCRMVQRPCCNHRDPWAKEYSRCMTPPCRTTSIMHTSIVGKARFRQVKPSRLPQTEQRTLLGAQLAAVEVGGVDGAHSQHCGPALLQVLPGMGACACGQNPQPGPAAACG